MHRTLVADRRGDSRIGELGSEQGRRGVGAAGAVHEVGINDPSVECREVLTHRPFIACAT